MAPYILTVDYWRRQTSIISAISPRTISLPLSGAVDLDDQLECKKCWVLTSGTERVCACIRWRVLWRGVVLAVPDFIRQCFAISVHVTSVNCPLTALVTYCTIVKSYKLEMAACSVSLGYVHLWSVEHTDMLLTSGVIFFCIFCNHVLLRMLATQRLHCKCVFLRVHLTCC